MDSVIVEAPAKVNLSLRILGRREDGFHDLETLFQAVGLFDTLEIAPGAGPGVELEVEGADLGPLQKNLVWRAASAFLERSGMEGSGVRIRLHKRIPHGAGLGGGSSDAAAALRGLSVLFGSPLDATHLMQLAAGLGSDVPFFMGSHGLALGEGRGERLRPLAPLPQAWVVLGLPAVHVGTAEAYAALAAAREQAGGRVPGPVLGAVLGADAGPGSPVLSWDALAEVAVNDFQDVVAARHPEVGAVLDRMRTGGGLLTLLSGSGGAVLAVFTDAARADEACAAWASALPEARFVVAPALAQVPAPRR